MMDDDGWMDEFPSSVQFSSDSRRVKKVVKSQCEVCWSELAGLRGLPSALQNLLNLAE